MSARQQHARCLTARYELDGALGLLTETLAITGARPSQAVRLRVADLDAHPLRPKLSMPKSAKGGGRNRAKKRHERYSVPITIQLAAKLKSAGFIANRSAQTVRRIAAACAEAGRHIGVQARAEAFEKITTAISAIERRTDPLLSNMRNIADDLSKLDHISFEMGQLGRHIAHSAGEVELAFAFVISDARRQMQAVKDGSAPIPRRPEAVETNVTEQSAPTVTIFMLKSAHYRDENGRKRFLGQWTDAIVPQAVAVRAMQLNVAVPTNDPRRAQLRGTRGGDYAPNAADVVDLDAAERAAPTVDPVLAQAGFTPVDRSADARTIKTHGPAF